MSEQTIVYLVGAGPGDPGLLTLRAKECLESADVVIYDYLASGAVMRFVPACAERVFVGKKGFSNHVTQDEINACIVHEAEKKPGRCIVRLKGGDPFVFGRGGEEALALREAGVAYQIVPGITAGIAAPAYAGIPVTHRTVASSVTLITGHETPDKNASTIDWPHLAQGSDTLCFYMGIRDLPMIVERLTANGRQASTPVALVRWGTTPRQDVLVATLDTVVRRVEEANFKAPAIIVVGDAVELRDQLAWFENRPLFGRTVVVTRSREQASELSARLRAMGAETFEFPTIELVPRRLSESLRTTIERIGDYDWTVFTSVNGVNCFFSLLEESGSDARAFAGCSVAAIGPATAHALASHGIAADLVPPRFIAEAVAQSLCDRGVGRDSSILLLRAAAARDVLPRLLEEEGAHVDVVPVYDTVVPDSADQAALLVRRLQEGDIDAVTFTSSSTAKNFAALLDGQVTEGERTRLLAAVRCISIGPVTSGTMREMGLSVAAEATPYTIPGLAAALQTVFEQEG
jgi:uroporphyrinogen III methyltransferase/synthase